MFLPPGAPNGLPGPTGAPGAGLRKKKGRINLIFCDNPFIRELNGKFRKLDRATDVLSFYYGEPDILGEIYISAEKAKKQAPRWENTYYRELKRLVVHGCLHLAGHDHRTVAERRRMQMREDRFL